MLYLEYNDCEWIYRWLGHTMELVIDIFYCSGTGEMINVILFDEPIRNLGIMREYLVTHCTNKIHL